MDAPQLQFFRGARKSKKELQESILLDQQKILIRTSNLQNEVSETVQNLLRKRLMPRGPRFTSESRQRKHYSTNKRIKDLHMKWIAPLDTTSEASQSKGQAIGIRETHGLMTRIDKANFRTICKKRLRSTFALTEERLQMSLAPCSLNGDAAQMVERSLRIREVRGSMPRISTSSEEPGNWKGKYGKLFC